MLDSASARLRLPWTPAPPAGRRPSALALALAASLAAALLALALAPAGALASSCLPVAQLAPPPGIIPAAFQPIALPAEGTVRLTFLGHSSFLIETAGGATAVTDYNGYIRPPEPPDVVTMNNAHSTHYTDRVEPGVTHVLRGWGTDAEMARHDVLHLDMRVRNVPTNVRDFGGTRHNGNSIFVFEIADLCIAHLGHLHHPLEDVHLAELGEIDVLLVPVDGSYTLAQHLMVGVIDQIRPAVVVPMHYFGAQTLARFLELMPERYTVEFSESPAVTLSRASLPYGKVLVLPGV